MTKLINISEGASIAIHSMILVSNSGGSLQSGDIATITGASRNHISKILQSLVKNNYLASTRGPSGGFELAKPANNVTLLELVELIEGKMSTNSCNMLGDECSFNCCIFGELTGRFTQEIINYLGSKTIADYPPSLMRGVPHGKSKSNIFSA